MDNPVNKGNGLLNIREGKVLSFGELLLRICPDAQGEWLQQNVLPFFVGGAEANMASALALWDVPTAYCSVIPDNIMTRQIGEYLQQKQVDISKIIYAGDKLGLYFLPKGGELKHAGVIYDRLNSSFSQIRPGQIDWDDLLTDVSLFHFSAISPAINQDVQDYLPCFLEWTRLD